MKYIIVTHTTDFDGDVHHNCFYADGAEGAWDLYEKMCDLFDEVDLVDYDTGEIIDSQTECDEPDEDELFIDPNDDWVSDFADILKDVGLLSKVF